MCFAFSLSLVCPSSRLVAQDTSTLHVETRLVVLDTVVTDRNGQPVSGLTRDDFRIYQDGVEQKIRNFDVLGAHAAAVPDHATKDHDGRDDWGNAPKTILVLDELNTPFDETTYARFEVNRYLNAQSAVLPSPTMVLYVNDYGFHPLGVYTRDRQELLKQVAAHRSGLPGNLTRSDSGEMLARSFALLQQIAVSTRGESGRKVVIWIGRGFPGFDRTDLPPKDEDRLDAAIRYTTNLLLDSRVTVYKVDPSPVPPVATVLSGDDGNVATQSASGQDPFAENFNFNSFVQETGGQYFYNRNDLDHAIANSVADGATYYTLSYAPAGSLGDGQPYHAIKVVMRDPNLHAATRRGYYSSAVLAADAKGKGGSPDLYESAVSGMVYSGIGTRVRSCENGRLPMQAACHLEVDTASLTFHDAPDGGHRTTVIAVLVALDAKNKILAATARDFSDLIPAGDPQPLTVGHISFLFQGAIPANSTAAKVIVRDESGRIGTAEIPLGPPGHRFENKAAR
jgi:VWFA-related protein